MNYTMLCTLIQDSVIEANKWRVSGTYEAEQDWQQSQDN